jgi:hypothetical protein
MAQTKKKRRSKHRGNAAGIVEARGRTGRKPTPEERKLSEKEAVKAARRDRLNKAPTWRSAANRAALAAIVFGVMLVLLFDTPVVRAIPLTGFVFLFYVPLGYYTDQFVYNRKQKLEAKKRAS